MFAKFQQINPNEPPQKIIEGDDPFNDQVYAASYEQPGAHPDTYAYGDYVKVIDPVSPYYKYTGIVSGVQSDQVTVQKLARGLSDRHGRAWDKGAGFNLSQLELRRKAKDIGVKWSHSPQLR